MSDQLELLSELLSVSHIEDLRFFELSARTFESANGADELEPPEFGLRVTLEDKEETNDSERVRISFHLRTKVTVPEGEVIAEPRVTYSFPQRYASDLSEELVISFANEIAVMTLIPYARQGLADMSQRVFGSVVLMPIFQRGQIEFSPPGAEHIGDASE